MLDGVWKLPLWWRRYTLSPFRSPNYILIRCQQNWKTRLLRLARAASTVHNFNAWNECWGLVAKTPLNSRKNESPVLIHRANATAKIPQNKKMLLRFLAVMEKSFHPNTRDFVLARLSSEEKLLSISNVRIFPSRRMICVYAEWTTVKNTIDAAIVRKSKIWE